jgi:hypothetical protein
MLAGLEARFDDRLTSIDEKLATMTLRLDQFEARTTADLSEIRQQIAYLTLRGDNLATRMDRFEAGLVDLGQRMDGLGEDMRQRFRVVNERLSSLAA